MVCDRYFEGCDVVCDRFFEGSLKEGVRHDRGFGRKIYFDENCKFPANFSQDFSRNSKNKEQLNTNHKFLFLHLRKSY